ncbi:DUF4097 family beta strand repeat-containing protein [Vagococcus elongatus]|uniref:DUF4097 domain-containing protein n=1 Tax=Vagococcus elongatus TaxID=180344 RepID=A0A430B626_9ENTE|nr:DUF4097 family beta strand repeat-containing protein [Vagococcus elongatus]RSU15754.1 hypothetical protein CBF29_01395 [Vagococcus elongatus]
MKKQRIIWLVVIAIAGVFLIVRNFSGWPWHRAITSETIESFDSVVMDLADADLAIVEGSQFELSFQNIKDSQVDWSVDDGQLVLSESSSGNMFFNFNSRERTIILTVPSSAALKSIEVSTEDSDVSAANINVEKLDLDMVDGELSLQQIKGEQITVMMGDGDTHLDGISAKTLELNSDDGDLYFNAVTANLLNSSVADGDLIINSSKIEKMEHSSDSGDITFDDSEITESLMSVMDGDFMGNKVTLDTFDFSSDDGDVSLSVEGKRKDYELILDSDDGEILVDDQIYRENKDQRDQRITVSSGDGDIFIMFSR